MIRMVPIDYLAVFGAAVFALILGALWYGPVFGAKWKAMMGFTDESMRSMALSPLQAMAGGFVTALAMAYILAKAIALFLATYPMTGVDVVMTGPLFGFWAWLGFAMPITAGVFLWEGKPFRLWVLNAGYYLVSLLGMGAILGYFG